MADCQRRAVAGADDQVLVALEHDRQRERAFQALERAESRIDRARPAVQFARDQVRDNFRVSLGQEGETVAGQLVAQFREILDDAVVDDRHPIGEMRMRIGFVRNAVRRPARVADADEPTQRVGVQQPLQIDQLTFGPAAAEHARVKRRNARGIIAAIFEPLQRIDNQRSHGRVANNSDNSAHRVSLNSTQNFAAGLSNFRCVLATITYRFVRCQCDWQRRHWSGSRLN